MLEYALGGDAPEGFLMHLIERRSVWDDEFVRRLEEYAYELRPDLASWELTVGDDGQLEERRLPLLPPD